MLEVSHVKGQFIEEGRIDVSGKIKGAKRGHEY